MQRHRFISSAQWHVQSFRGHCEKIFHIYVYNYVKLEKREWTFGPARVCPPITRRRSI